MAWILDNLQLVVIVASAFAWWWSQRRGGQAQDRPEEPAEQPPAADSYEELERTRRIQEEIRRKIAERSGRAAPVDAPPIEVARPVEPPPLVIAPAEPVDDPWEIDRGVIERQQRLDEELRELEAQRAGMRELAEAVSSATASAALSQARPSGGRAQEDPAWLQALRDRRSVRQAIVLREILGPPAALR